MIDYSKLKLLHDNVLVVAYSWPEKHGSLYLPKGGDSTWTLWEVVRSSKGADDALGQRLEEGDILVTARKPPIGLQQAGRPALVPYKDGRDCVVLSVGANEVKQVIKKTWED